MITIKDFMEIVDYKINDGSEYCWNCFGENARFLGYWDSDGNKSTVSIVYDTKDQTVYTMEAWDNEGDKVYRWIHPDFLQSLKDECEERGIEFKNAFDDVDFIDLETSSDIMEKARAIHLGESYDTRVEVPVNFTDEELFSYMKLAHEQDITLNQLIEKALRLAIEEHKAAELENSQ
jgi:hypothetical protein